MNGDEFVRVPLVAEAVTAIEEDHAMGDEDADVHDFPPEVLEAFALALGDVHALQPVTGDRLSALEYALEETLEQARADARARTRG